MRRMMEHQMENMKTLLQSVCRSYPITIGFAAPSAVNMQGLLGNLIAIMQACTLHPAKTVPSDPC